MLGRSSGWPLAAWHSLEALWLRHYSLLVLELTAPKHVCTCTIECSRARARSQGAFEPRHLHETCMGSAEGHATALGRPGRVVLEVDHGPLDLTLWGACFGQGTGSCRHSLGHLGASHYFCALLLQRSAGSSSPEAGEGKELPRTLGCPGAKPEHSLTPPTLCLDSDHEDGNYCPPVKRERTSSLTHAGERQPRKPGRTFPRDD